MLSFFNFTLVIYKRCNVLYYVAIQSFNDIFFTYYYIYVIIYAIFYCNLKFILNALYIQSSWNK